MIMARPMGVVRTVLFFGTFLIARVPVWFIIIASLINGFISPIYGAAIIVGIIICKGYIESEIAGSGMLLFTALRVYRFFAILFGLIAFYAFLVYFSLAADSIDKALMALGLMIAVYLYYGKEQVTGYWSGYRLSTGPVIVTTLLWLYICFVPDTLIGNITILAAIYFIEFYFLYNETPLEGLPEIRNSVAN